MAWEMDIGVLCVVVCIVWAVDCVNSRYHRQSNIVTRRFHLLPLVHTHQHTPFSMILVLKTTIATKLAFFLITQCLRGPAIRRKLFNDFHDA